MIFSKITWARPILLLLLFFCCKTNKWKLGIIIILNWLLFAKVSRWSVLYFARVLSTKILVFKNSLLSYLSEISLQFWFSMRHKILKPIVENAWKPDKSGFWSDEANRSLIIVIKNDLSVKDFQQKKKKVHLLSEITEPFLLRQLC